MNRASYVASLILLVFSVVSAKDAKYFEKSIFQALRKRDGQFRSEIEVRKSRLIYDLQENFSFKLNIGERIRNFSNGPAKTLYLSGEKEWHRFGLNPNDKFCISYHWYNFAGIVWELLAYAPRLALNENSTYNIIGPNVLLEILFENHLKSPERVRCEANGKNAHKCAITFEDAVRLEYSFSDRDDHTMYPERIEYFDRNAAKRAWRLVAEFVYLKFSPVFSDEQIVSPDLPAGKGCHRSSPQNYPRPQTNYGDRFELECELTFDFALKREKNRNGSRSGTGGQRTTRRYPAKLYVDRSPTSVAETVDETTNASIRMFYAADTGRLDAVADGQCRSYDLTANRSLNWFYLQEMFVRKPELFSASNYSYLHRTDGDAPCLVFEKQHVYLDGREDGGTRNLTQETVTSRRNQNGVPTTSIYVLSTHYYELGGKPVPRKIDLTILDPRSPHRFDSLTIHMSSFNDQPKEPQKYDRSNCSHMVSQDSID